MKRFYDKKAFFRIQSVILGILTIFLCFVFFHAGMEHRTETVILFLILILSIIILGFCMRHIVQDIFDRISHQEKKALQEQQMKAAIQLSGQTRAYEEKVFRVHHDMKNHLGMIRSMLMDGNEKQAEEYLEKLRAFLNREGFKND